MRVQNGMITDYWGVGNLPSLMQQIGGWIPPTDKRTTNIIRIPTIPDLPDKTCIKRNGMTRD